jgi:hypothetical protein
MQGKSVWGSGFLPSVYQGVQCRSEGDPVLFIKDPEGMDRDLRKASIDAINEINKKNTRNIKTRKFFPAFRNMKWLIACRYQCQK